MNELDLFRSGHDYLAIAKTLGLTARYGRAGAEAEVERRIHALRGLETEKEFQARKAEEAIARAIASVPKPPRIIKTDEEKKAAKRAYNARTREQIREIRRAHAL